jgi:hypothetical protein
MDPTSRRIDLPKVYTGVFLICLAAIIMVAKSEDPSPLWQAIRFIFMGVGIFLYLWGRLFSRGAA